MKVDKPAADFSIKDIARITISLSSLEVKTVIVDFRTTYYQCCIASIFGMQKAVNYFINDKEVINKFILVAKKIYQMQVKTFMEYKGHRMDVWI